MPKKAVHTPYSEEVAIPFEIFQTYYQEADKRRTQMRWAFAISLVLGLAVVALLVALPFLAPILAVSAAVSAAGLLEVYLLGIVPFALFLGFFPSLFLGAELLHKPHSDFNFTENSIQILPGTYHFYRELPVNRFGKVPHESVRFEITPPGITLSKLKKNDTEYTLVSPNQATSASISENILGSLFIQQNTHFIFEIMKANSTQKQYALKHMQENLNEKMNDSRNSPQKNSMLSDKLATLQQQITACDQTIQYAKTALSTTAFKYEIESKYRYPIQALVTFLENHKKQITRIHHANMKINQNIQQFKLEKKKHPGLEMLSEKIQALETLKKNNLKLDELRSILASIPTVRTELQNMKQGRPQSEIDYIEYAIAKMESDKQTL